MKPAMVPQILPSDSAEYEILYEAARAIRGVPGLTCEIGLREGGGTEMILRGLRDSRPVPGDEARWHVAVDTYGSLPYEQAEGTGPVKLDYCAEMRRRAMRQLF